jgi:hypothetical protein
MTEEFNKWWNNDLLTQNNPYVDGTPAFWAWEGWCAGVKAEREACAKVCMKQQSDLQTRQRYAAAIRNRRNK